MRIKTAIGQDSHRFAAPPHYCENNAGADKFQTRDSGKFQTHVAGKSQTSVAASKPLLLGGVEFQSELPLLGNSDADVVLHALCNAISGVTGINILGAISDRMCLEEGITDSAAYVKEAAKYLGDYQIAHVSFSIECAKPAISPRIADMRENIASIIGIGTDCVCITATSGEGLTDFGRGLGIQVFCMLTACSFIP